MIALSIITCATELLGVLLVDRWLERRAVAKAERLEYELAVASTMNAKAAQALAQLARRTAEDEGRPCATITATPGGPVIEHRISGCQPVEQALDVYLALIGHPVQTVEVGQ